MGRVTAGILAVGVIVGLTMLGVYVKSAVISAKRWDRIVTVKGLSERQVMADRVIWPIQFVVADNKLPALHRNIGAHSQRVLAFLQASGVEASAITLSQPQITDKLAQQYCNASQVPFRYHASRTITVVSDDVEATLAVMDRITGLVKEGVALSGEPYAANAEFVFTRLNDIKPSMIEEATVNARQVAQKFARDSASEIGKIKRARQGQFSITSRDRWHPHIKLIRVVSTIDYTLID
ncbi:SIMPL domain-containing protein [Alteromonas sp. CYL-A6]|uniref:SIMPL domain-containing protein n=1 Tax=Alteromonas nitratireducens TaxID=3390813 RepID=UPI0034BEF11E